MSGIASNDAGVRSVIQLDADRETFARELAQAAQVDAELARSPGVQSAVRADLAIERTMTANRLARRRQGGG